MASLGHIAVGAAAARIDGRSRPGPAGTWRARTAWPALVFWSALSMLPDADVVGFALGVEYGTPWGHRGATHSFAFAALMGLIVGAAASLGRRPMLKTGALATLVVASHPLLDTMTDGGLGCALFWPFDLTRYFAPWRPIPVAPIGLDFLSLSGLLIGLTEIVLFLPLFAYGLGVRSFRAWLVPIWAAMVWLLVSGDPVRENLVGYIFDERTEYAPGYSEQAFRALSRGDPEDAVRRALGQPFGEWWVFARGNDDGCPFVFIESGVVTSHDHLDVCTEGGVPVGMTADEVRRILGTPETVCGRYTRGLDGRPFRHREVCFSNGVVSEKMQQWMQ